MAEYIVRHERYRRRATDPTWGSFTDWTTTLRHDPGLVTPIRVLWRDYLDHCRGWGFPACGPKFFVQWIKELRGVTVAEGGRGRIRRLVTGLAVGSE